MPSNFHCHRCDKRLPHVRAKNQHYEDSTRHNPCDVCSFDGFSWDELLQHHRRTRHRTVCQGCNDGEGMIWISGSREYLDHIETENVCTTCERHFDSPSNLEHHKIVHLDASIECYGCSRKFTIYAGMIIHLESGACDSGIDIIDLNESAAMCFQWRHYIDPGYHDDLLQCRDLDDKYDDVVYPFKCPACKVVFTKLSGLFQHIGSPSCGHTFSDGAIAKLVRWLEKRHT